MIRPLIFTSTAIATLFFGWTVSAASFAPLIALPAPRIVSSSPAWSIEYDATNLLDGNSMTEYASKAEGVHTEVEFDFGKPVRIAAFRHVDRDDPATIAESELEFFDENGQPISSVTVKHVNRPRGETFFILPTPIIAQRVKWRVTKLGNSGYAAVGGAEISFLESEPEEPAPNHDEIEIHFLPVLEKSGRQPVEINIHHPYAEPADVVLSIAGLEPKPMHLSMGANSLALDLPAVQTATPLHADLQYEGQTAVGADTDQEPVRPLTIYVVPMSHTDIGYALGQAAAANRQVNNLVQGIQAAQRTADYPTDARFVWNVEVLWAVDNYLHRMDAGQRGIFIDAVRKGQVELNGSYANELTGLCRPEELIRLFHYATEVSRLTGVPIQSAMISDVPGYTWGTVNAMAQAGIKYFSASPNDFDRIGTILRDCENRPFYWVAPDGKTKVLAWIPYRGYAMSMGYRQMSMKMVRDISSALDRVQSPYDITYIRWAGWGDNAVPDPAICDFIRDWNATNIWPHFIISGTTAAFQALEQRYGSQLPRCQGDWTPYWEDGAGSSARETAMNRNNADRLTQAESLWAMLDPKEYPAADFRDAWRNVLLYSEHTWGADCSIRRAESQKTKEQWNIKKSYPQDADRQSRELMAKAIAIRPAQPEGENYDRNLIQVVNTLSWTRSGLVIVPPQLSFAGDSVTDDAGRPVVSQRLNSGELAMWADDVPPFGAKRYTISPGEAYSGDAKATVEGATLGNGAVRVRVDRKTGGIEELTDRSTDGNLADTSGGEELNEYLYLRGDDLKDLESNGHARIEAGEKGPLLASLIVQSDAPGCNELCRELQVVAGQDDVEIINLVDKARLQSHDYIADKESVNFAFPFNVPGGDILVNIPLAGEMRPDADQIPGSCKNWFTVGRWADVSNQKEGVTWVTLDAPLIEIGGITATLLNSQTNPDIWRKRVGPAQRFYSWVMNNHWSSNYRAFQEGPTVFRYILRPHGKLDTADATRFATGCSQPLLAIAALDTAGRGSRRAIPLSEPLLRLSSDDVVVSDLKPADDGKAWIVRLFGVSGQDSSITLDWGSRAPKAIFLSDTAEDKLELAGKTISVPGYGLVTLRAEF